MTGERLAELHVHLEGTVRRDMPYEYTDLAGFFSVYLPAARSMQTAADFERVIGDHAASMAEQGILYAEVSINPSLHPDIDWWQGVVDGRQRAMDELGVEINWLIELVRGLPYDQNEWAVDFAIDTANVVGLGLVGDESLSTAELKPLIERARKAGLGFMPHAGQAGGPNVVREAFEVLGAHRVAHGIAAIADESLMRSLASAGVCLCVCPSSNAKIGLHPDYRVLADHGVALTVNTDDPAMVGTTLVRELEIAERYGLNRSGLIEAAWKHRFGGRS